LRSIGSPALRTALGRAFLAFPTRFRGAATQTKCGISRTQSAACKAPSRMTWFLRARGAAKPKPRRRMGSFQVLVDPFRSPEYLTASILTNIKAVVNTFLKRI